MGCQLPSIELRADLWQTPFAPAGQRPTHRATRHEAESPTRAFENEENENIGRTRARATSGTRTEISGGRRNAGTARRSLPNAPVVHVDSEWGLGPSDPRDGRQSGGAAPRGSPTTPRLPLLRHPNGAPRCLPLYYKLGAKPGESQKTPDPRDFLGGRRLCEIRYLTRARSLKTQFSSAVAQEARQRGRE